MQAHAPTLRTRLQRDQGEPMRITLADLTGQPGASETIATKDGARLFTLSVGDGPAVVLAHGYGGAMGGWFPIASRLAAQGRRAILFNQRGHGAEIFGNPASTTGSGGVSPDAMASDYRAVLEHYDAKDAVLAGHSMGGYLAQRYVLNHPDEAKKRLRHVLLLATTAGRVFEGSLQNRLQIPLIRSGALSWLMRWRGVAQAFTRSLVGEDYSEAMGDLLGPVFRSQPHRELWPVLDALGRESHLPRLGSFGVPCSILVGDRDRTTPLDQARALAVAIPGATFEIIPGAGHMLIWERVELLTSKLLMLSAPR